PSAENMATTGGSDSEAEAEEHLELCLIVVGSKYGPRTTPETAWLKKLYPTERLEGVVLLTYLVLRLNFTTNEALKRLAILTKCRPPINDLLKLYDQYTKTTEYFEVGSDLAQKYDWLSD
ncbi:MAG: hypothetical protein KAG66_02585, partial [Methylococcales bacterium]|nr:hypothetical protein [Methylococcales bacterium]